MGVLGPVQARTEGRALSLGTPKQRALVAALVLSGGRPVSVDSIVDLLWGESPPPGVTATLQAYVSGLRRVLEPDRERRAPARVLVTQAPGYAFRVDGEVDAQVFERTVADHHAWLQHVNGGPPQLSVDQLEAAVAGLDACLELWRGTPYSELDDAPAAVAERVRLEELRLVALEDRTVAHLALGHHGTMAAQLESMTATHPLRERLWGMRALALTRAGRQADALDVLRQVRTVLADELGLEPGVELRELQAKVLRQDPLLEWVAPPREATIVTVPQPRRSDPTPGPGAVEPVAPWPMVGRAEQLASLVAVLDTAASGAPSYAVVTGEPGIGKSRLAAELMAVARARGIEVLAGRCSQDDGAPPLWPWSQVLDTLCGDPIVDGHDSEDEGARFRAWERITKVVRNAAATRPVLVVLDDLHWADPASLRVLRLLAEATTDERLMVLSTWRAHPEPTGLLGDVAETLARSHAQRISLSGLGTEDVAEVFATVASNRPSPDQADALRARTDGNPFFLVEYARLAGARTDLGRLVTEEHPPSGVHEVLTRRLARLPEATVAVLRTAATIGRQFDGATLALVTEIDEDDLLDVVEPAQAAGLVREDGIDRFTFAHALVRDTLVSGLSPSRRARAHARVAQALTGATGRETEQARHWLAAGPAYAGRGWRSAVEAARQARHYYAHEQAAELLSAALDAMALDPEATPRDRYDVLLHLVDAYRWSAMWPELTATVEQAVAIAESIGDAELVARAAISTTQGALWQSAAHGQVHEAIVAALRRCLDELPTEDGVLRCRSMLSLANELYYGASFEERRALVDEALAMARRIGDEALLLDACQIGYVALWRTSTAPERLRLADEAMELAERTANERAYVVGACLRAVVLGELGRVAEMWDAVDLARRQAERLRIHYGMLVLDSLVLPWAAMAGRWEQCDELMESIRQLAGQVSLEQSEDAVAGAAISLSLWRGGSAESATMLRAMEGGPFPITATVVVFLWRAGRDDDARAYYAAQPRIDLTADDWFSMLAWCNAAEAALYVGDSDLGAAVYERLAPYAGRACSAGSGNASGPVDAFLALAAAATGERGLAARHADAALATCEEWAIPLAASWLRRQRDRFDF